MEKLLFKNVKCNAYLKKMNDGRFIEVDEDKNCTYIDTNNEKLDIVCTYCGDDEFLKTYYKIKKRNFEGIVVGIKDIVVSAYLCVDIYNAYDSSEHIKIFKNPNYAIRCAIVYFANNRKSYVPLDSLELLATSKE